MLIRNSCSIDWTHCILYVGNFKCKNVQVEIKYSLEARTRDVKTIVKRSTRENVSLFLNESFENVLICIISIGPSGTFRPISNFPNFCQNKNSLELLNIIFENTVEPVNNGPVLSGHPLLSGHFLKSRLFAHTNAVFVTCIRRPPLLSGRGHPVAVLCLSFFVILPLLSGHP